MIAHQYKSFFLSQCTIENKEFLGNKTADQTAYIFTISDFDGGVHSGYGLTDIDAVWPVRWIQIF